jgi:hypothetical protein
MPHTFKLKDEQVKNLTELLEWPKSGSNENGNWIKYRDGIMICWGTFARVVDTATAAGNIFRSEQQEISYPQAFYSHPSFLINVMQVGSGVYWCGQQSGILSTTVGRFVVFRTVSGTGIENTYAWQAIGRWKE